MVKLQAVAFPLSSVAVNSMVLTPTGKSLPLGRPLVWETVTPQLSNAIGIGKFTVALHIPVSVLAVIFAGQAIVGGRLSSTVTTATQVLIFPFTSVTVKVTLFGPISAQVKSVISITEVSIAQLSVLPPSTSVAIIEAFPVASNCTVIFWHKAVGSTSSITSTVKEQVAVFPEESVAVSTTVLIPTGNCLPPPKLYAPGGNVHCKFKKLFPASSKYSSSNVTSPQFSVIINVPPDPLNTQPVSVDCTEPVQLLNCGASVSLMVTSKEQVCTGLMPSSYSKVLVVVPTGKVLPLGKPAICTGTVPPPLSGQNT